MRRQPQRKPTQTGEGVADLPPGGPRGVFARKTIAGWLNKHFYLRLHMTLIIALTFLAGMAATNVLMWLQANPLALRYALTVTAAYLAFLALIRLWLWYIGIRTARSSAHNAVDLTSDGIDVVNFNAGGFMSGTNASVPSTIETGGGHFGGGGASGSWGEASSSSSSDHGASSLLDIGGGDDSGAIALIIAIIVAVIVAAVAALYVIYAAPAILSEVAFQGVLAAAMARRTRHMSNTGWVGAVWRKTFWAFLAVMAVAIAVGWIANHFCPQAITLQQALHCRPL